jgi:DivIVA domain-containing protein
MDSTDTTRSALDQIKDVNFRTGLRGYVVDEVDEFLDAAALEVDELREQMHQLRQQLRQASERIVQLQNGASAAAPTPISVLTPAPAPAPTPLRPVADASEQVASMIAMAHQFIEQAQGEAEAKARELTTSAQERAREIINEARSRAEDEVQRLNGLKQRLSEDVEGLTRQISQERTRVKKVLGDLHQWIEDSMHVSVTAPRPSAPEVAPIADSGTPAPVADVRPLLPPPAPSATIGDVMGTLKDDNHH